MKSLPEDKCWLCGRPGLHFKHVHRRMLISAMKLKLMGEKPENPDFLQNLNREAKLMSQPVLVAVVIDKAYKAACPDEELMWDAIEQNAFPLVCSQCLLIHGLTQAPMIGVAIYDLNEVTNEARKELGEEIADYLQNNP
ncbi:MAG: hypothetical protein KKE01_07965 [Candidatus Omnitrophica bacterium]|nr:hypothetical protein [Candidatus Omnitrophota bacterium]